MQRCSQGSIEWLQFDVLKNISGLVHGVFCRHGGVSEGAYASLNVGDNTGDDGEKVAANRKKIADVLGLKEMASAHQCHGTELAWAPLADSHVHCDGLVTCTPGVGLMITHADCQAAILYDPLQRVVAAVHCGWRGNVQNMYAHAVNFLVNRGGCRPQDLLVGIGPSLGPTAAEFKNFREEFPAQLWPFQISPNYFDLWEMSRQQLLSCGVLAEHIEIASICTYSTPQDYYSYRREKITGRHATVVALI